MGTLICWWDQTSHIKGKGHLRSSCKIGWKCEIWPQLKSPTVTTLGIYHVATVTCAWGERSKMKVKGHKMSICKITWKYKIWHTCIYLRTTQNHGDPNTCRIKVRCQFASSTNCHSRWHWQTGDHEVFYCCCYMYAS